MSHRLIRELVLIREEFTATRASITYVLRIWSMRHDEAEIAGQKLGATQQANDNLEATYLVRVFARFEAILRDHFPAAKPNVDVPEAAAILIDQLGAHYRIPAAIRSDVHAVRRYRNAVAHAHPGADVVLFADAMATLNRYLAWLP